MIGANGKSYVFVHVVRCSMGVSCAMISVNIRHFLPFQREPFRSDQSLCVKDGFIHSAKQRGVPSGK